jgi:hypothetical protein
MSGLKYNVSSKSDPYLQTQILFVNDSNAFVVGYTVGETEKSQISWILTLWLIP